MVSLASAKHLKEAGLGWEPAQGDQFVIPDRGMDEQVYTLNDMAAIVETLKGTPAITFHGTPEWALDYIWVGEVVWLPSESQLRQALERALAATPSPVFDLVYMDRRYTCRLEWQGQALAFSAADAGDAYAAALLHVIRHPAPPAAA